MQDDKISFEFNFYELYVCKRLDGKNMFNNKYN